MKKHLITAALPYANGPLHFGHLAGAYIPADVYARHRKMQGEKTLFISGSDEHGVAIMLNANKTKIPYQEYVDGWHQEHKALFQEYDVEFDFFGQTSADYHAEEVVKWFSELNEKGMIETKDEQQLFCKDCKNHLPDRFVEGTCYECGFEHARGDECPKCGLWIEAIKLKAPVCKICDSRNIEEVTVTQYYLMLSKYYDEFRAWFNAKEGNWRKTVFPFIDSLSKEELHNRAISRDLDWGIDVPLAQARGKKLYVWFDAPIGYVSNTKEHLKQIGSKEDYLADWWNNDETVITNFIGKDNIIFHGIIFPVMSMASGIVRPVTDLPANQYVNLAGKQFSKSTGHYVDADKALKSFGPDALRYYLISIIPEFQDSSFTWTHMAAKVNNELANNIGNLVNRCLKFWKKNWTEGINESVFETFFDLPECQKLKIDIGEHTELLDAVQIRKALEKVMSIGADANTFFSDRAPWAKVEDDNALAMETIGHTGLYIATLGVLLAPYMPSLSSKLLSHFPEMSAEQKSKIYRGEVDVLKEIFVGDVIMTKKPKPLVPKLDDELIAKLEAEIEN
ncbi:MAG: methionine--tRNA ligase [Bacteriovoracaceae bacterium]|nr:methionine--tRNA ligase [Bacteriovoracaceae bacterium]